MARQGRAVGRWRLALLRPCCGVAGAWADNPRGMTWGPALWAGWKEAPGVGKLAKQAKD